MSPCMIHAAVKFYAERVRNCRDLAKMYRREYRDEATAAMWDRKAESALANMIGFVSRLEGAPLPRPVAASVRALEMEIV